MIKINGITLPEPKYNGLKISKNKIWSSNAGRSATGDFIGDLITIKYKLEMQWAVLTSQQVAVIDAAVSQAFFTVTFEDLDGAEKTITCYAGDPDYPVLTYALKKGTLYKDVAVNVIGK